MKLIFRQFAGIFQKKRIGKAVRIGQKSDVSMRLCILSKNYSAHKFCSYKNVETFLDVLSVYRCTLLTL